MKNDDQVKWMRQEMKTRRKEELEEKWIMERRNGGRETWMNERIIESEE